jgi:hexosaminidase
MTQYGAYGSDKIYYPNEVQDLLNFAQVRGVKIIPELDAPAHAGNYIFCFH